MKRILSSIMLMLVLCVIAIAQSGTAYRLYAGNALPLRCNRSAFNTDVFLLLTTNTQYICANPAAVYPSNWLALGGGGGGGTGDVVGPASSVNNELVTFSGATGKLIQRSAGNGFVFATAGVASYVSSSGTGAVILQNSPSLVTPNLGTPSAATLTNATGLPIATGVSGLGTGIATWLATPNSTNLISAVTDETGTGALVFGTSPTIVTPTIASFVNANHNHSNAAGGGQIAISSGISGLGTGVATLLATFSSANLAAALTDEIGTGSALFGSRSGNTSTFVTATGTLTAGRCAEWDANGNIIQSAAGCAAGSNTLTVSDKTSNYTVLTSESKNVFTNTGAVGAVIYTLPTPAAGLTYTFIRTANQSFTIDYAAGITMRSGATVSTSGGDTTLDAVGSTITIVGVSSTSWVVTSFVGTATYN